MRRALVDRRGFPHPTIGARFGRAVGLQIHSGITFQPSWGAHGSSTRGTHRHEPLVADSIVGLEVGVAQPSAVLDGSTARGDATDPTDPAGRRGVVRTEPSRREPDYRRAPCRIAASTSSVVIDPTSHPPAARYTASRIVSMSKSATFLPACSIASVTATTASSLLTIAVHPSCAITRTRRSGAGDG